MGMEEKESYLVLPRTSSTLPQCQRPDPTLMSLWIFP